MMLIIQHFVPAWTDKAKSHSCEKWPWITLLFHLHCVPLWTEIILGSGYNFWSAWLWSLSFFFHCEVLPSKLGKKRKTQNRTLNCNAKRTYWEEKQKCENTQTYVSVSSCMIIYVCAWRANIFLLSEILVTTYIVNHKQTAQEMGSGKISVWTKCCAFQLLECITAVERIELRPVKGH